MLYSAAAAEWYSAALQEHSAALQEHSVGDYHDPWLFQCHKAVLGPLPFCLFFLFLFLLFYYYRLQDSEQVLLSADLELRGPHLRDLLHDTRGSRNYIGIACSPKCTRSSRGHFGTGYSAQRGAGPPGDITGICRIPRAPEFLHPKLEGHKPCALWFCRRLVVACWRWDLHPRKDPHTRILTCIHHLS